MVDKKVKFPFTAGVLPDFFNVKNSIFTAMNPAIFLEAAAEPGASGLYKPAIEDYIEKISKGKYVGNLYLETDGNMIVGHEGRHRARAAIELGIFYVPVVFVISRAYLYEGYKEMREIDAGIGKGTREWLAMVGKYQSENMKYPSWFSRVNQDVVSAVLYKQTPKNDACGPFVSMKLRISDFDGLFAIIDCACKS